MSAPVSPVPIAVVARAAYLRASGQGWEEIAQKLALARTDAEALSLHSDWPRLSRLAARAVRREAEAEARRERRRAFRSGDEDEKTAAAEEEYRLRASRREAIRPPDPTDRDRLVRAYLECLNSLPAEDFIAMEAADSADPNVTPS